MLPFSPELMAAGGIAGCSVLRHRQISYRQWALCRINDRKGIWCVVTLGGVDTECFFFSFLPCLRFSLGI